MSALLLKAHHPNRSNERAKRAPMSHEMIRTSQDDPCCCQATLNNSRPCHFKAVEGTKFCLLHNRNVSISRSKARLKYEYALVRSKARYQQIEEAPTELHGELAIVRLVLDSAIESIEKSDDGAVLYAPTLNKLIFEINLLTEAITKSESALESLLDHRNAYNIANMLLQSMKDLLSPEEYSIISKGFLSIMEALASPAYEKPKNLIYRLQNTDWDKKLKALFNSDSITQLACDVSVIRVYLEDVLNTCKDVTDMLMKVSTILSYVQSIRMTINTLERYKKQAGLMLNEEQSLALIDRLTAIVLDVVKDPARQEAIHVAITSIPNATEGGSSI